MPVPNQPQKPFSNASFSNPISAQPAQPNALARALGAARMLYGAAPAFIVAAVIAQIILPPHLKPAYLIGDFGGSTERAEIEAKQAAAVEFAMLQAAAAANAQANAQMETEVSRKEQEIIAESLAAQSTGAVIADFSCFLGSLIPRDTYGDLQTAGQVMRGGCGFGDKLRNNIVQTQAEAARQGSAILQRDHAEFLPWSREEYERPKDDVLAEGGVFFDLDQSTGTLKMSISPEAENRLTKAAAKMGMDLDTYLNQICQHYVDQVLAEERAAKV
jgi:hypothetical protein